MTHPVIPLTSPTRYLAAEDLPHRGGPAPYDLAHATPGQAALARFDHTAELAGLQGEARAMHVFAVHPDGRSESHSVYIAEERRGQTEIAEDPHYATPAQIASITHRLHTQQLQVAATVIGDVLGGPERLLTLTFDGERVQSAHAGADPQGRDVLPTLGAQTKAFLQAAAAYFRDLHALTLDPVITFDLG